MKIRRSLFSWAGFFTLVGISIGLFFQPVGAQTEDTFFAPHPGTPIGIPNFTDPASGCNWLGVAGQVFDRSGNPIQGLVIKIEGVLGGNEILLYGVTGGVLSIGPGGFLLKLANLPLASENSIYLQVLSISGDELTPRIQVQTYADCQRNLILLNVKETILQNALYFPIAKR
jgi:hypothetical protein